MRGCTAYDPGPILPQSACVRLILFCTRPPLCAGAPWPMPAWVWRDVQSVFFVTVRLWGLDTCFHTCGNLFPLTGASCADLWHGGLTSFPKQLASI